MDIKKLVKIFFIFFKIGIFTIGGGLVMLPIMHNEFVEKQKWVDDDTMTDIFAVAQALPGVVALNSSMYIGYELYGVFGAVVAAVGISLPSVICILVIFFALTGVGDNVYLAKFYLGVRSAVVALITIAAYKLGKKSVVDMFGVIAALFGIAATLFLKLDVPYIVLICGFSGYLYYCLIKGRLEGKNGA